MKKHTPTLHPTQQRYAAARTEYDLAREAVTAALKGLDSNDSEAYIEAWEAADEKHHTFEKMQTLSQAETAMVEWSKEVTRTLPQYRAHAVELEEFWKVVRRHPISWKKFVELAFKLNPNGGIS
jgi:hypothetical protein